jgi:hypothetical protein
MSRDMMKLERANLVEGSLAFTTDEGMGKALRDGAFYLSIPDGLDIDTGRRLCREFYRSPDGADPELDAFRGFREADGIYFDREHFQTEHLLMDGPARERHLPAGVFELCNQMSDIAVHVLKATLAQINVPEDLWDLVTNCSVSGGGTRWFAASHYRPERDQLGCAPHKDTGFVTILYIEQDGLEAWVGERWTSIAPLPGHFVVNFGGSLELLTAALEEPVKAILHRVRQCFPVAGRPDRFSFAAFANPAAVGDLYQFSPTGEAVAVKSVEEFLRNFNEETWKDQHSDFGIVTSGAEGTRA